MFVSTPQIEPGLFHFLLLFRDAVDFQYQSLAELCSYLRKVTESQKSFTKNIDEKLSQVHWKEQKASLFLLELSVFCETHWFCCDLYFFYPDARGIVFAFIWGRTSIQSSHPVLDAAGWTETWLVVVPTPLVVSLSIYSWVEGLQLAVGGDAEFLHLTSDLAVALPTWIALDCAKLFLSFRCCISNHSLPLCCVVAGGVSFCNLMPSCWSLSCSTLSDKDPRK